MADLYDDEDDYDSDLNWSSRAQAVFDQLNDDTDWTWSGIAKAFVRHYTPSDISELMYFLEQESSEVDE